MKNTQKKTVVTEFFTSATKNAIEGYSRLIRQARMSGAAYRAREESVERQKIREIYAEELMMPYQSQFVDAETGVNLQIPAAILGATEAGTLTKVARRKLKLATNQMKIAELFFDFTFSDVDEKKNKLVSLIKIMEPEHTLQFCQFLVMFPQEMRNDFIAKHGATNGMKKHNAWVSFVEGAIEDAKKQLLV